MGKIANARGSLIVVAVLGGIMLVLLGGSCLVLGVGLIVLNVEGMGAALALIAMGGLVLFAGIAICVWSWRRTRSALGLKRTPPKATPFALGPAGNLLVSTNGAEVIACLVNSSNASWAVDVGRPIAGVRNSDEAVLVVDDGGLLKRLDPSSGRPLGEVATGRPAIGLAATREGRWAVIHADGITVGQRLQMQGTFDAAGTTHAAFSPEGTLAVAVGNELILLNRELGEQRRIDLSDPITGLCGSPGTQWLVTSAQRLEFVSADLSNRTALGNLDDGVLSGGVVSPTGKIVAVRVDGNTVHLMGVKQGSLGSIRYPARTVGELEFGPHPYLSIGLGLGDGNYLSLLVDSLSRTDPPAGRKSNRWLVAMGLNYAAIREELNA